MTLEPPFRVCGGECNRKALNPLETSAQEAEAWLFMEAGVLSKLKVREENPSALFSIAGMTCITFPPFHLIIFSSQKGLKKENV